MKARGFSNPRNGVSAIKLQWVGGGDFLNATIPDPVSVKLEMGITRGILVRFKSVMALTDPCETANISEEKFKNLNFPPKMVPR